jgi:hypothetical protein
MTCLVARPHEPTHPALAWKLGGAVAAAGGRDEDSNELPRAAALGLHPWQVACLHEARKRGGRTYAATASVQVVTRVLLFRVLNVRSLRFQWTSSEVG